LAAAQPGVPRLPREAQEYHHHLQVAMHRQGHSTFGQAQAEAGVVIDSRTLHAIHDVGPQGAVVEAGVRWLNLLTATVAQGYTPPVLTDFLELSVGGVPSMTSTEGLGLLSSPGGLRHPYVTARISPAIFYRYMALGRRAADHASCNEGLSRGRTLFDN
jgi:FAD/FMN-containing dehydrogenase